MKLDILSIANIEVINQLSYLDEVAPEVIETIHKAFKDVRVQEGNKTVYIQQSLIRYEEALYQWNNIYKIQVQRGLITKTEAYTSISQEIETLTGETVNPLQVKRWIKEQDKLISKFNEREGKELEY